MNTSELTVRIRSLLWHQLYAVLATVGEHGPHTTIVTFAAADDLGSIVFPTPRATRKYANLHGNPAVSLLVDDRVNTSDAVEGIHGVEARGTAYELSGVERTQYETIYCARHGELSDFVRDSALIRIAVDRYDVVHRFQNVYVLDVHSDHDARNGGPQ